MTKLEDIYWKRLCDKEQELQKLQKENKQLKEQLDIHKILLQTNAPSTCILTELEEWLKDNLGNCRTNQKYALDNSYAIKEDTYMRCLDKLLELKEKYK